MRKEILMDQSQLAAFLERPDVQKQILGGYRGGYSLGLTRGPHGEQFAIRVRIEGDDPSGIPSEISLGEETIPVVVKTRFRVPEPF
jgi:hypothetical protein